MSSVVNGLPLQHIHIEVVEDYDIHQQNNLDMNMFDELLVMKIALHMNILDDEVTGLPLDIYMLV
jgi:hypothetical protein